MADDYEQLLASGLPITWTAIRLGREAILISEDQVQSYAGDQLGFASVETEYLVFRLFDADPTNRWEIRSVLDQLAESEWPAGDDAARRQVSEAAERTWNLLAVREFLCNVNLAPTPDPAYEFELEDVYFFLELLSNTGDKMPFPAVFDFELPEEIARTKPMYVYLNSEWPQFEAALSTLWKWADGQEVLLTRKS